MNDMLVKSDLLDIIAPVQQEGTRAVLRTWLKEAGSKVAKDEPVAELETDKVVVEVCAPGAGTLRHIMPVDQEAAPGALLGQVDPSDSSPVENLKLAQDTKLGVQQSGSGLMELRMSPSVRRLVAEYDLDVTLIVDRGTGRGGRLTRQDVLDYISHRENEAFAASSVAQQKPVEATVEVKTTPVAPVASPNTPPNPQAAVAAIVPHSTMRRKIAEHMQHSVSVAPHVTSVFEVDFSAIMAHRKRHKDSFAEQGVKLTFTAYFIAACVQAMKVAPEVNSRWHADHLEVFRDVNIGVGAALGDKGLIVPVIHQAQDLSLLGIAARLQAMTEAARNAKLKPSDVQGGTFTISNHGVSGSLFASPIIINQPQSAILGVGALEKRVMVREVDGVDTLQIRPMAYVSLTIDHRVLDGSQTNAWLSRFTEVIQSWSAHN